MKINKIFFAKTKNPGISLLIALGTSSLVLIGAMYTILSVKVSLENAANIERSTQLFFAAESGIEAAFFHHNARGAGTSFTGTHSSQTINHPGVVARTNWTFSGRTTDSFLTGILREGTSVQIPLSWDAATNPEQAAVVGRLDGASGGGDSLSFSFYEKWDDILDVTQRDDFEHKFGEVDVSGFDFGDSGASEVLVDWFFSRKSDLGIQTFSPKENAGCVSFNKGFICEDQLTDVNGAIDSSDSVDGRVLPGFAGDTETLDNFFLCQGTGVPGGPNCLDYSLTFRSLLPYTGSDGETKIKGVPFLVSAGNSKNFPLDIYSVVSSVTMGNLLQEIDIEIPEKTSIGAFDYVIFD